MRRLAATLLALFATPAMAGDFATLAPIGFSPDGRVFLFEQYGIQDGSGFPYSEIVAIDLDDGGAVAPAPIRVRLEHDNATLADARRQALAAAAPLIVERGPFDPGLLAAAAPPTELSADPYHVRFLPRAIEPSPDEPVELRLTPIPFFEADERCTAFGHTVNGFRLVRTAERPGEAARIVHEDASVPANRTCPFDYRIAEVRIHTDERWTLRGVVLVAVKQVGFEGPDLRYMAVPLPLD